MVIMRIAKINGRPITQDMLSFRPNGLGGDGDSDNEDEIVETNKITDISGSFVAPKKKETVHV